MSYIGNFDRHDRRYGMEYVARQFSDSLEKFSETYGHFNFYNFFAKNCTQNMCPPRSVDLRKLPLGKTGLLG